MQRLILIIFISIYCTSCNVVETLGNAETKIDPLTFPKLTIDDLEIEGTSWISACENAGSFDVQTKLSFSGNVVNTFIEYYVPGNDCAIANSLEESRSAIFSYDNTRTYLDPTIRDMTLNNQSTVTRFKTNNTCGINTWTQGTAENVLSVECLGTTRSPGTIVTQSYRVYSLTKVEIAGITYFKI